MKKSIESVPAPLWRPCPLPLVAPTSGELENLVERAVILTQGTQLQVPLRNSNPGAAAIALLLFPFHDAERDQILRTYVTRWVIGGRMVQPRGWPQAHHPHLQNQKLGLSRPSRAAPTMSL